MCLAVLAFDAHPAYALVVAANRDEYHARPTAPAAWGGEAPFEGILAGRDLLARGTWLGVRRNGTFAFVTNVRDGRGQDPAMRSRGEIVPRVLNEPGFVSEVADGPWNGFNLVVGSAEGALWISNRAPCTTTLTRGLHGLSNASLDVPWPKVTRTQRRIAAWSAAGVTDIAAVFEALADREPAFDDELPSTGVTRERERLLSPPFIVSEDYGTRCSTIFTVSRDGRGSFHERSFAPDGSVTGDVIEAFDVR